MADETKKRGIEVEYPLEDDLIRKEDGSLVTAADFGNPADALERINRIGYSEEFQRARDEVLRKRYAEGGIRDFIEYPLSPWPVSRVAVSPPSVLDKVLRQMLLQDAIGGPVCVQHAWYTSDLDLALLHANLAGTATGVLTGALTIETDLGQITFRANARLEVGEIVSIDTPEE